MRQWPLYIALVLLGLGYKLAITPEWLDAIGTTATAVVRPVVIPLVQLINAPAFVYVFSTVILVAAVAVSAAYWHRAVRPRVRALKGLQDSVQRLPSPGLHGPEVAPDALRQLGAALRAAEMFPTAWAAFQAQAAREGGIPGAPFSFFAASDPTTDEGERRGLMQALPSYFTSLGLILTFVGLVVALYFAAKGFRSGNVEEARLAILQLLNASSFKFLTSVAALVSALLVSLVLRFGLSTIRRETNRTVGLIEGYLSAWRDLQGQRDGLRSPMAGVTERLDALISGVGALSQHIERLVQRLDAPAAGPRIAEVPHAPREAAE